MVARGDWLDFEVFGFIKLDRETSVIFIHLRTIVLGDEFMAYLLHSVIVDQFRAIWL